MSHPQNPLDKYRGFSTHHVLLVSHTSEALRNLTLKSDTGDDAFLDRISEAKLGEPIKSAGGEGLDVYLLLDSRKLSNFIIKSIDYQSSFSGGELNRTQSIWSMINLTLIDPSAIAFINYLKKLTDDLFETDFMGLTFLLKTLFVGHTDSNTTEIISTLEIPMIMVDLSLSVDHTGGHYDIKFAPLNGSVTEAFPGINSTDNISALKGFTLGEMLDNLQNELNNNIRKFYNSINIEYEGEESTKLGRPVQYMFTLPGDIPGVGDKKWRGFTLTGILSALEEQSQRKETKTKKEQEENAQYEKDIKETRDKMKKDGKTQVEIDEVIKKKEEDRHKYLVNQYKSSSDITIRQDPEGYVILSLSPATTIPDILATIFGMCPDANALISYDKAKTEKKVSRYKTKTYISSDISSLTVHYDILEQTIVDVNGEGPSAAKDVSKAEAKDGLEAHFTKRDGKRVPKNSIEFDYIFSGKNTDILGLEIKINNATLFLTNTDALSEEMRRQQNVGATDQKKQNNEIKPNKKTMHYSILKNTPITAATRTASESNAHASIQHGNDARLGKQPGESAKLKQEALNLLSDFHGVSSQEVKLKIRGNPDLLAKAIYYSNILPHVKINDIKNTNVKGNDAFISTDLEIYKTELKQEIIQSKVSPSFPDEDVSLYPMYCKVNIFGPNVDIFGEHVENEDFGKQFWYDGWYYIREINHTFNDGEFTQELTMSAVDMFRRFRYEDNEDDKKIIPTPQQKAIPVEPQVTASQFELEMGLRQYEG